MNDLNRWHHQDDDEEVDGDNDGSENTESTDRGNLRSHVSKEGSSRGSRGHSDGTDGSSERVGETAVVIFSDLFNVSRLAPGITVDKDVISSDSKHDENG